MLNPMVLLDLAYVVQADKLQKAEPDGLSSSLKAVNLDYSSGLVAAYRP